MYIYYVEIKRIEYYILPWVEYKTTWAARVILGSSVRDTVNLTVRTLTKPSVLSNSIVGPSANYTCNLAYYSIKIFNNFFHDVGRGFKIRTDDSQIAMIVYFISIYFMHQTDRWLSRR